MKKINTGVPLKLVNPIYRKNSAKQKGEWEVDIKAFLRHFLRVIRKVFVFFILLMKCMEEALCQIGLFLREKETRHGKWSLRVLIRENGFV
jgi:hypothetical protein